MSDRPKTLREALARMFHPRAFKHTPEATPANQEGARRRADRWVKTFARGLRVTPATLEGLYAGTHVIVPVEPTIDMELEGKRAIKGAEIRPSLKCYRAMLAAAKGGAK